MENNNNIPENQNEVNFSIDEHILVVEAKPENKNNKLPIILIICVLVIALISGIMLFVFKSKEPEANPDNTVTEEASSEESNPFDDLIGEALQEVITDKDGSEISRDEYASQLQQQLQEATTILNEYVGSYSPNEIVENTTSSSSAPQQETTTVNTQKTEKAEAQIKAFFDRSFYIQGALYSDGSGEPLRMSLDGENFEILTNLDGTEISFLKLDGTMYLKRTATNQYVELTEAFFNAIGIDPTMMNFNLGDATYENIQSQLKSIHDININGKSGICYEYKNEDQAFKFYFNEDVNLRQIEILDNAGTIISQFSIDFFSESIPGDQLSLKGFEKTGMGTMFADLM